MRIGFDISQTGTGKAGCGYYAYALIDALLKTSGNARFILFRSFGDFFFDPGVSSDRWLRRPNAELGPTQETRSEASKFWNSRDLERHLKGIDVIHSNNFWCPRPFQSTRLIYTLYDLSFVHDPNWTTEENRIGCFQGIFRAAVAADWVVAISKASRDDFLRIFPTYDADRVCVIHPCSRFCAVQGNGAKPRSIRGRVRPRQFFLSVGTVEPRKNYLRLAESYARYIATGGPDVPLVIAGGSGWLMEDFVKELTRLGVSDRIILTGYVSDEELIWLYGNCLANVYVSVFEGFGLPALEGMEFGAPTIASNTTSIPEVVGDAAILVNPMEVEAISAALMVTATNEHLRTDLGRRARMRAAEFAWNSSATRLMELYRRAIGSPKRRPRIREIMGPNV